MNVDLDLIKEIGNIGVGSASTALSNMLNKSINISIPAVYIKSVKNFLKMFSENNDICLMIYSNVEGDISGGLLTIYTRKFLEELLGKSVDRFTKIDRYKILKYNDVLTYSYINSIGQFLNIELITVDSQIIDKDISNVLANLIMDDITKYREVIINETKIFLENKENICYITLLLSKDDLERILSIARERYGL